MTYEAGAYVWAKVGRVWWPGQVTTEYPDDVIAKRKNAPIAVLKFKSDDEDFHAVVKPGDILPYVNEKKEEFIRKGRIHLEKRKDELEKFILDAKDAEKATGGDESYVESVSIAPATPKKPIYAEIFKPTPPPAVVTPPAPKPGTIKLNFNKKGAQAKKGRVSLPTPQIVDGKKYSCDHCGFSSDRVGVIATHRKSHTVAAAAETVAKNKVTPQKPKAPPVPKSPPKPQVQAKKASPVKTPKPPTPRKRKAPKEQAKEEILADWNEEEGDGSSDEHKERPIDADVEQKKPRTDKELSDAFESLLQTTKPPTIDDQLLTKDGKASEKAEVVKKAEEESSSSDMDMDTEAVTISGSGPEKVITQQEPSAPEAEAKSVPVPVPEPEPVKKDLFGDKDKEKGFDVGSKATTTRAAKRQADDSVKSLQQESAGSSEISTKGKGAKLVEIDIFSQIAAEEDSKAAKSTFKRRVSTSTGTASSVGSGPENGTKASASANVSTGTKGTDSKPSASTAGHIPITDPTPAVNRKAPPRTKAVERKITPSPLDGKIPAALKSPVDVKPAVESNLPEAVKSAAETKPEVATKSTAEIKPELATKSTAETKPAAVVKSAAETKPEVATKSTAETKPAAVVKSAAETKPAVGVKSAAETKPAVAVKSAAETKPAVGVKSTVETKKPVAVKSAVEIEVALKSAAEAKPPLPVAVKQPLEAKPPVPIAVKSAVEVKSPVPVAVKSAVESNKPGSVPTQNVTLKPAPTGLTVKPVPIPKQSAVSVKTVPGKPQPAPAGPNAVKTQAVTVPGHTTAPKQVFVNIKGTNLSPGPGAALVRPATTVTSSVPPKPVPVGTTAPQKFVPVQSQTPKSPVKTTAINTTILPHQSTLTLKGTSQGVQIKPQSKVSAGPDTPVIAVKSSPHTYANIKGTKAQAPATAGSLASSEKIVLLPPVAPPQAPTPLKSVLVAKPSPAKAQPAPKTASAMAKRRVSATSINQPTAVVPQASDIIYEFDVRTGQLIPQGQVQDLGLPLANATPAPLDPIKVNPNVVQTVQSLGTKVHALPTASSMAASNISMPSLTPTRQQQQVNLLRTKTPNILSSQPTSASQMLLQQHQRQAAPQQQYQIISQAVQGNEQLIFVSQSNAQAQGSVGILKKQQPPKKVVTYPGRKQSADASASPSKNKPTATIKPTMSDDEKHAKLRQAVHQATPASVEKKPEKLVAERLIHLLPVENVDGTITYMTIQLDEKGALRIDSTEGPPITQNPLMAIYAEKGVSMQTVLQELTKPLPEASTKSDPDPVQHAVVSQQQQQQVQPFDAMVNNVQAPETNSHIQSQIVSSVAPISEPQALAETVQSELAPAKQPENVQAETVSVSSEQYFVESNGMAGQVQVEASSAETVEPQPQTEQQFQVEMAPEDAGEVLTLEQFIQLGGTAEDFYQFASAAGDADVTQQFQMSDGSMMDVNQYAQEGGGSQIMLLQEDGSLIDPAALGLDIAQLIQQSQTQENQQLEQ